MKVLVFGGTGWVGHNVARLLAAAGHKATIACRGKDTRFPGAWGEVVHCDKNDKDSIAAAVKGRTFDAVIDTVPLPQSVRNAHDLFGGRIAHYIHCSSTGVYPPLKRVPATEEHSWREPTGFNFPRKIEVDSLALEFREQDGFPATIIRPSNICGPGLIPLDVWGARRAGYWRRLRDSMPVTVPNDGMALLQPCDVRDVAKSFVLALGKAHTIGKCYNISAEYSITLNDYVEISRGALNSESPVEHAPVEELIARHAAAGEINATGARFIAQHMCFDISLAARELGYSPDMTPETGTEAAIRWMRDAGVL